MDRGTRRTGASSLWWWLLGAAIVTIVIIGGIVLIVRASRHHHHHGDDRDDFDHDTGRGVRRCASLAAVDSAFAGADMAAAQSYMTAYRRAYPLDRFEFVSIEAPLPSAASDSCADVTTWFTTVVQPQVDQIEQLVADYVAKRYNYIMVPSYSLVLRPWLQGFDEYDCNSGATTLTFSVLGGLNVNQRWPGQKFLTINPGTGVVDNYADIVRFQDTLTGNDISLLTGNFDVFSNFGPFKIYIVQQQGDVVAQDVADSITAAAASVSVTPTVLIIGWDGTSFSSTDLSNAATTIHTDAVASPGTTIIVAIAINSGVTDQWNTGANANFYGPATLAVTNVVMYGANYAAVSVAATLDIKIGLTSIVPFITHDLVYAGYPADLSAPQAYLTSNYLDAVKWVSRCYTIATLPVPPPYAATGSQWVFIKNTAIFEWLQVQTIPANDVNPSELDRHFQMNGLWWGESKAVPY